MTPLVPINPELYVVVVGDGEGLTEGTGEEVADVEGIGVGLADGEAEGLTVEDGETLAEGVAVGLAEALDRYVRLIGDRLLIDIDYGSYRLIHWLLARWDNPQS